MLNSVQKFVSTVMKNNFLYDESNNILKYHNTDFDVLVQKKKNGDFDSCMVIDKRKFQYIYYTDIGTALKVNTKKNVLLS